MGAKHPGIPAQRVSRDLGPSVYTLILLRMTIHIQYVQLQTGHADGTKPVGSLKTWILLLAGAIRLPIQYEKPKTYVEGGLNSVSVISWPGDFGGITSVTKGDKGSTLFRRITKVMHTKTPSLYCLHFFPSLTETEWYLDLQNDIGLL